MKDLRSKSSRRGVRNLTTKAKHNLIINTYIYRLKYYAPKLIFCLINFAMTPLCFVSITNLNEKLQLKSDDHIKNFIFQIE